MSFVWVGLVLVLVLVLVIPGIGGWRIDEPTSRRNDDSVAYEHDDSSGRTRASERATEDQPRTSGRRVDVYKNIKQKN
jgi:hypothetical protein